jgi:hypothetical protein
LRPITKSLSATTTSRFRSNLVYGLNRMAQVFAGEASEGRLEVFRSEDAAKRWLLGSHQGQRRLSTVQAL